MGSWHPVECMISNATPFHSLPLDVSGNMCNFERRIWQSTYNLWVCFPHKSSVVKMFCFGLLLPEVRLILNGDLLLICIYCMNKPAFCKIEASVYMYVFKYCPLLLMEIFSPACHHCSVSVHLKAQLCVLLAACKCGYRLYLLASWQHRFLIQSVFFFFFRYSQMPGEESGWTSMRLTFFYIHIAGLMVGERPK